MARFFSQAHIELADPKIVIAAVCRHMTEHNAELEEEGDTHLLRFKTSSARFVPDGEAIRVDVEAADMEGIYFTRLAIASHIIEFAEGQSPRISWQGAGDEISRPPNFEIMAVKAVEDVTPHMRRLTLQGERVERFLPLDALHLNVLVQRSDAAEPQWPTVGPDGLIQWPDPAKRPDFRKYTVRSVDVTAGTMDLDFVIHSDAGPGSSLAQSARPGDRIGIAGPGGGGLVDADWYLFAGDETALPAIGRMLEALPDEARGSAFIEVADEGEVQPLRHPAGLKVTWLLRKGIPAGTANLLPPAVEGAEFPSGEERVYVWAGCEFDDFRAIRKHVRNERGLQKHEHLVVSYWRRGVEGD
nr:siderophore-interacting protein [Rhizobium sp. LCM 4573]